MKHAELPHSRASASPRPRTAQRNTCALTVVPSSPPSQRRCTSPAASEAFFAAASSQDKVMHLVPGGYHEVRLSVLLTATVLLLHALGVWWVGVHGFARRSAAATNAPCCRLALPWFACQQGNRL